MKREGTIKVYGTEAFLRRKRGTKKRKRQKEERKKERGKKERDTDKEREKEIIKGTRQKKAKRERY
jgi:hypothetical protein